MPDLLEQPAVERGPLLPNRPPVARGPGLAVKTPATKGSPATAGGSDWSVSFRCLRRQTLGDDLRLSNLQKLMRQFFSATTATLFGDPRRFALEHRLFNTISLLNAVANVGGAFAVMNMKSHLFLFALNFGTGLLFLLFYYLSRFRSLHKSLYWPFVLLMLGFLFV